MQNSKARFHKISANPKEKPMIIFINHNSAELLFGLFLKAILIFGCFHDWANPVGEEFQADDF
jgi:hypothetical protein